MDNNKWISLAGLLSCLLCSVHIQVTSARDVTHEDIRDAMLSLVHMFRTSEDKLERHEFREKALGEQLKKALAGLDKRHRALDPLRGAVSRLDERLSSVETILIQKEENEKVTHKQTTDSLDAIKSSIDDLVKNLPLMIKYDMTSMVPTVSNQDNKTDERIAQLEKKLASKIDFAVSKVDSMKDEINKLKDTLNKESILSVCKDIFMDGNPFGKHMAETEQLLTKYDLKLSEYNTNLTKVQTDFVPLGEVTLADEAWHNKMTTVMEKQEEEIRNIAKLLASAESMWKGLPSLADLAGATNKTMQSILSAQLDINSKGDSGFSKLAIQLNELVNQTESSQEQILKKLTDTSSLADNMFNGVSKSYEELRNEVQGLTKVEKVMIQTADNVLDTKRRIEYGVHQILLEVGGLIKEQGKELNETVNNRFNTIEFSIVEKQSGALANLSSKIEQEIVQVWRQIGIMHEQLTASKTALDRLQHQTEQYVNGSITTMDSMEGKVGMITSRMGEVDENLNYLLGRLSLVTHEFNNIKTGLGDALDNIKTSFLTVQRKIKDAGPGPHQIPKTET